MAPTVLRRVFCPCFGHADDGGARAHVAVGASNRDSYGMQQLSAEASGLAAAQSNDGGNNEAPDATCAAPFTISGLDDDTGVVKSLSTNPAGFTGPNMLKAQLAAAGRGPAAAAATEQALAAAAGATEAVAGQHTTTASSSSGATAQQRAIPIGVPSAAQVASVVGCSAARPGQFGASGAAANGRHSPGATEPPSLDDQGDRGAGGRSSGTSSSGSSAYYSPRSNGASSSTAKDPDVGAASRGQEERCSRTDASPPGTAPAANPPTATGLVVGRLSTTDADSAAAAAEVQAGGSGWQAVTAAVTAGDVTGEVVVVRALANTAAAAAGNGALQPDKPSQLKSAPVVVVPAAASLLPSPSARAGAATSGPCGNGDAAGTGMAGAARAGPSLSIASPLQRRHHGVSLQPCEVAGLQVTASAATASATLESAGSRPGCCTTLWPRLSTVVVGGVGGGGALGGAISGGSSRRRVNSMSEPIFTSGAASSSATELGAAAVLAPLGSGVGDALDTAADAAALEEGGRSMLDTFRRLHAEDLDLLTTTRQELDLDSRLSSLVVMPDVAVAAVVTGAVGGGGPGGDMPRPGAVGVVLSTAAAATVAAAHEGSSAQSKGAPGAGAAAYAALLPLGTSLQHPSAHGEAAARHAVSLCQDPADGSSAAASRASSACAAASSWQAALTHSGRASPLLASLYTRQHTQVMASMAGPAAGEAGTGAEAAGQPAMQGVCVAGTAERQAVSDAIAAAMQAGALVPRHMPALEADTASQSLQDQQQQQQQQQKQQQQQPRPTDKVVVPRAWLSRWMSADRATVGTRACVAIAESVGSDTTASFAIATAASDAGVTADAPLSAVEARPGKTVATTAAAEGVGSADPTGPSHMGGHHSPSWLVPQAATQHPLVQELQPLEHIQQQQQLRSQRGKSSEPLSLGSVNTTSLTTCSPPQQVVSTAAWESTGAGAAAAAAGAAFHGLPPPPAMPLYRAPAAPCMPPPPHHVQPQPQYGDSLNIKGGRRSQLLQYYWASAMATQGSSHLHQAAASAATRAGSEGIVPASGLAAPTAAAAAMPRPGVAAALGPSGEPRVPLSALASLDIARLSCEVSALVWIGQGGGGAVFQGLWQGARVAVKFLLAASPAHVDASALEAIVSLSVAHPNVVHTYCAEVARVDEASLAEPAARPQGRRGSVAGLTAAAGAPWRGSTGGAHEDEDAAVTALYNALIMETTDMSQRLPPLPQPQPSSKGGSAAIDGVLLPQHLPPAAPAGDTGSAVANTGARRGTSTTGGGAASGGNSAAEVAASQRLQPPAADSHAITSFFESHEGFGEPDLASNDRAWTVRQVLTHMEAQPSMYLTHIIMEHCDRGSLLSAIKRGIFRLEPEAAVEAAEATGPSSASSLRSTAHSSKEGWATTVAAAASGASGGRPGLTRIPEAAVEAGRFPRRVVLRAILRTARDIAQGMAHLHANGIIHGDLKPGNVLLRGCRTDRRGFVAAVADFGLSKVVRGDQPLELDRWSTVTVMAPETIQGRWHKASDVYAFGILLWQLVTSEVMPYGNLTVGQILLGVSQGTLRPGWPGGVHPALVRLGRACLATNASERPSFDAIAKVLTKIETNVRNELREQQRQQRQRLQQQQLAVPAFVSEGGYSQEGPGGSSKAYVRKYSAV